MTPEAIAAYKQLSKEIDSLNTTLGLDESPLLGYADPWDLDFTGMADRLDLYCEDLYKVLPDGKNSNTLIANVQGLRDMFHRCARYIKNHQCEVVDIPQDCPLSVQDIAESIYEALNENVSAASCH